MRADSPPIGTIMAWAKSLSGVPALGGEWAECDGSVLSDAGSKLDGVTLPDLNGNNNFLRGASTSGSTGGSATHTHGTHTHVVGTANHFDDDAPDANYGSHTHDSPNSEPPYYEVVWIIRIK